MRRFSHVLRRVDRRLEVREPERSRILLELAGDLEDLYRAYRDRGCGDEEARRRAEAWLVPDDGSLDGLRRLHTPLAARLLSPLSEVARSRLETLAFTVLALGTVAAGLGLLWTTPVLGTHGPWTVAVLALGGLGAAAAARRGVQLFVSSGSRGPGVPGALPELPALGAGAALVGALGGCVELERALASAGGGVSAGGAAWAGMGTAAGTAALGLLVALALALAWFWLVARVRAVRRARAELHDVAPWMEYTSS